MNDVNLLEDPAEHVSECVTANGGSSYYVAWNRRHCGYRDGKSGKGAIEGRVLRRKLVAKCHILRMLDANGYGFAYQ